MSTKKMKKSTTKKRIQSKIKQVKAWVLLINNELDVNFDMYATKKRAEEYGSRYRGEDQKILPCTITFTLATKKR